MLFHRTDLAETYAKALLSTSPVSAMPSGLFLAAPRRTGKSTFLRQDLAPALERAGALVIYVDLWADPAADPAGVIARAVATTLDAHAGSDAGSFIRRLGVGSISIGPVTIETASTADPLPLTFDAALEALSKQSRKMIVLLIDEAQHATTTRAGTGALFALKAARDSLNGGSLHGLRLVATGSNRDKLAALVNTKAQAFYRAMLDELPALDEHYVRWFVAAQGLGDTLELDAACALFSRAGHQPELPNQAADRLRMRPDDGSSVADRFGVHLDAVIAVDLANLADAIAALEPLERAVLGVLATHAGSFVPFGQPSLDR